MINVKIPQNLVQIKPKSFVSRSAMLTHYTCHYKHYLLYWAEGSGYTSERQSLDLLVGSCIHRGLQYLLEHCRIEHPDGNGLKESCIDAAVNDAINLWQKSLMQRGLALKCSEEYDRLDWIIAEQETLIEGLIRAWALFRLPSLLDEHEILEVEREEVFEGFSALITFLGKADGLLLRKSDRALIPLSIKSASEYAEVTARNVLHDMQGVSETFLVQERLSRWWKLVKEGKTPEVCSSNMFFYLNSIEEPPKVFATQYEYLIKGQRRENEYGSKVYYQQSFLCHPLKLDSIMKIRIGVGAIQNPAQYKWKWGKGKYPKGWAKEDIWNDIGIKQWVGMLHSGQVQPELGHPFQNIIVTPDLVVRSDHELKEWYTSTKYTAERIRSHIDMIESVSPNKFNSQEEYEQFVQELIWMFFPKNTQSCHEYYGRDCEYVRHCHELESFEELTDAGELIRRIPHHDLEKEALIKKGLIEPDAVESVESFEEGIL